MVLYKMECASYKRKTLESSQNRQPFKQYSDAITSKWCYILIWCPMRLGREAKLKTRSHAIQSLKKKFENHRLMSYNIMIQSNELQQSDFCLILKLQRKLKENRTSLVITRSCLFIFVLHVSLIGTPSFPMKVKVLWHVEGPQMHISPLHGVPHHLYPFVFDRTTCHGQIMDKWILVGQVADSTSGHYTIGHTMFDVGRCLLLLPKFIIRPV